MASKALNVGMIGYGFMGRAHSNAYRKVANFFDLDYQPVLKAACGRNRAKVEEFAYRWGYEEIETDWKKLVARKDIDAIDICVPNDLHMEIAIAAAKAGKMVLTE
jgi:predicted dehydrogenase